MRHQRAIGEVLIKLLHRGTGRERGLGTDDEQGFQVGHPVAQVALGVLLVGAGQHGRGLAKLLVFVVDESRIDAAGHGVVQRQLVLAVQGVSNQLGVERSWEFPLQGCRVLRHLGRVGLVLVVQVQQVVGIGGVLAALVAGYLLCIGLDAFIPLLQLLFVDAAQLVQGRLHLLIRSLKHLGRQGQVFAVLSHQRLLFRVGVGHGGRRHRVGAGAAVHAGIVVASHRYRRAAVGRSIGRAARLPVGAPVVLQLPVAVFPQEIGAGRAQRGGVVEVPLGPRACRGGVESHQVGCRSAAGQ